MTKISKYLPFVLGAGFIFFGAQKFGTENAVFEIIAERSGLSFFEPHIRRLTGIAELFAGLFLILPSTRKHASLLGLAILLGAVGFHLSPWLGINVPGIGHGLFFTALAMTVLNTVLVKQYFLSSSQRQLD